MDIAFGKDLEFRSELVGGDPHSAFRCCVEFSPCQTATGRMTETDPHWPFGRSAFPNGPTSQLERSKDETRFQTIEARGKRIENSEEQHCNTNTNTNTSTKMKILQTDDDKIISDLRSQMEPARTREYTLGG